MSKPDWVGEDVEKLFLWGEAVKLQIPDNLLAYEASTRGFVGQPLGGKDKILISQHTNRLKHHNSLFPYFKLHDPAPKLCTSILSPYRMPFGTPFLYADKAGMELGGFLSVVPACDVICFSGPCGTTIHVLYVMSHLHVFCLSPFFLFHVVVAFLRQLHSL